MSRLRCLFVLSADFGEYVTASVLSRGQPIDRHFALPAQLGRYCAPGQSEVIMYAGIEDLERLVDRQRYDVVVLCSGYLFAVNRLISPEALREFIVRLRRAGTAVATTDPWLRIWTLRPGSRLAIHSIRKGGVDEVQSDRIMELQRYLEQVFEDVPHLLAVPVAGGEGRWVSVFNSEFAQSCGEVAAGPGDDGRDEWLFVLSREDLAFLAGSGSQPFFRSLEARIDELTALDRNRLTFVGPEALGPFFTERMRGRPRVTFVPFCDFVAFESAIRRARIVAYWNVLSASLLYCLYHDVVPVFFGKGHQAKVCEGLYEHAVEHVYRGTPPLMLDWDSPLVSDTGALIEQRGLRRWLDGIRRDYAGLPAPAQAIAEMVQRHAQR